MSLYNAHKQMILMVAQALGDQLLQQVAFVGGCTTGLLITDEMTKESVRYTDDVDLIISVMGYTGWHKFSEQLVNHGFRISMDDEVNCRFRLDELQVDFMPDDADVLGFTNRWYKDALKTAETYLISDQINIRLVTPIYFLATKFEAFKGRGKNDLLSSRDIEDILNVIDGRAELHQELLEAAEDVKGYLVNEFKSLLNFPDINYLIQSTASNDKGRAQLIFERIKKITTI
jgi:predicted nucleotidyltransferase